MTTSAVRKLAALAVYRVDQRHKGFSPAIMEAHSSLEAYGKYVHSFAPEPFHQEWIAALEDLSIDRLLIVAPPNHAKTQYVAIQWPEYLIGNNPDIHIILVSNTYPQAARKGMAVRNTLKFNPRYRAVFPGIIPTGKWAEHEWTVQRSDPGDKDPTFLSFGILGPITGARAHVVIFDDINDEDNTATDFQREKIQGRIESTVMPRLITGGKAVGIMTRWHHRDMAQVWKDEGWTVLHYPALNDSNEALWESRNPASKLLVERALHPLTFERVYQGRPTAQEGAIIKEQWWRYYQDAPEACERIIQFLDTAYKTKTINDYTALATWGLYKNNAYLLDLMEIKVEYPELRRLAETSYMTYHPHAVYIEDAASGQSLYQDLKRNTLLPVHPVKVDKDKVARVNAIIDYIASGRVYLPEKAPWLGRFIRQHSEFPLGEHDDMVDTTSGALGQLLLTNRGLRFTRL